MSKLSDRILDQINQPVVDVVRELALDFAAAANARAVLYYGSGLRSGSLDGVLDFYVLVSGPPEKGIWPRVSYYEFEREGRLLRTKVATMTLAKFVQASDGSLLDTTIWTRFSQPCALVFASDDGVRDQVAHAVNNAIRTAARTALALGPRQGRPEDFWAALFQATYRAEFRIEREERGRAIINAAQARYDALLPLALQDAGIPFCFDGDVLLPQMADAERTRIRRWWMVRRYAAKALNIARLLHAVTTFDGAAHYAAWKIERHTGHRIEVTPWRERHPVLAAPGVLWSLWRKR